MSQSPRPQKKSHRRFKASDVPQADALLSVAPAEALAGADIPPVALPPVPEMVSAPGPDVLAVVGGIDLNVADARAIETGTVLPTHPQEHQNMTTETPNEPIAQAEAIVDAAAETTSVVLSDAARAERLLRAQSLVKSYVLGATGISLIPVPLVDLAGIFGVQLKLIHGLSKQYGVPFKENLGKSLLTSLLTGATGIIGVTALSSLAKSVPVLGSIGGAASVGITSGALTYAVGQVFIKHFEKGGTLLNFDPAKFREIFKKEVAKGKEVAQQAKAEAKPETAAVAA